MKDLHIGQPTWNWHPPYKRSRSLSAISLAACVAFLALFLCLLASFFGTGAEGGWLSLPPDYTLMGWTVRLLGAGLGLGAFTYLSIIQHRRRNARRSRRRIRPFPKTLVRVGMAASIASVAWEIAILAVVVASALTIAYGMFGEDGI